MHAQLSLYRHYTVNEGLAHSTVYYVMQDSKGYIWFCTEAGVNRFDGRHFETFTTNDGLADNINFECYEDSKGRIWFLSYNGRLSYYQDTGFVNETINHSLTYNAEHGKFLAEMEEDSKGNIWFSVYPTGIYKYDGNKITFTELNSGRYCLFAYGTAGVKTIEYMNDRYCLYNLSKQCIDTFLQFGISGPRNISASMRKQELSPGLWYFVTSEGLEHIDGNKVITDVSNKILKDNISCFKIIGNNLWLGTREGLYYIPDFLTAGFTGRYKRVFDGLWTASIVSDKEGGIWLNTLHEGVYYLPGSRSYITNMQANALTSIKYRKETGLLAAANNYGEIMLYGEKGLLKKYRYPKYPAIRINELRWISNTQLLVMSDYNPYIYDLTGNYGSAFFQPDAMVNGKDVDIDTQGIWICGRSSIYLKRNGISKLIYGDNKTHHRDKLVSIAANGASGCWFTSISKLYWLDIATLQVKNIAGQEVFHSGLTDIAYVNGYLWIATHGNGIFVLKDGKQYYHFNSHNSNLTGDICQRLVYDGQDKMWVATNRGISVFNVHSFRHTFKFSLNDVLINNDIKDMDICDNKAYVATPSGVSIIDISKYISTTSPPAVLIKNLVVGTKEYNHLTNPEFKYFRGNITLSYTAITYQANQSVSYRYRMIRKDELWNETKADQVQFYALAPGKYIFSVSAKKYNSAWSKPVLFTFTVLPLWYQTISFRIGSAIFVLAIIYMVYRRQIKRIRKSEYQKTAYNKRIAELEGNALANQMNPHFIFNSLNTVQQFILKKDEQAGLNYLSSFSTLIREILKYSREKQIDIEDEIRFLERYLDLEQKRFKNKFTYAFNIDEEIVHQEIEIPPMLIQPLLENAVKYGTVKAGGHIKLDMHIEDDMLVVTVEDNGIGINAVRASALHKNSLFESTALKVIESRLKLLQNTNGTYGSLILLDKNELDSSIHGTRVIISIPLENKPHHDQSHNHRR